MAVEYVVKFENGSLTVTQIIQGRVIAPGTQNGVSGNVLASKQLGYSFPSANGAPAGPQAGQGGVGNESIDPSKGNPPPPPPGPGPGLGGVGNESIDPSKGNPPPPPPAPGPGGVGNESIDPGGMGVQRPLSNQTYAGMPFQMQTQQESEWCWAAVSASVDHYFQPGSYSTQCSIASQVIPGDCCVEPDAYDEPERLQDALGVVGRLRGTTGPLTFEQLKAEIDANRPVCIRIAWDQGGAHFVALAGYQVLPSGARTVDVADPFYGSSTEDFDMFPSYYHGGGTWTASFLTN